MKPDTDRNAPRVVRTLITLALAALGVGSPLNVMAQSAFTARFGFETYERHCCGYYPFNPAWPIQVTLNGGGSGELKSTGHLQAERTANYEATGGPGSMRGNMQVTSFDKGGAYNTLNTSASMELMWSDSIRVEGSGTVGSSAPVKLYVAAMYLGGQRSAGGYVNSQGFGLNADNPYFFSETVVGDFKLGQSSSFSAAISTTALANTGNGGNAADFTDVALFWLLEPVNKDQQLFDSKGVPLPKHTPFMEGLFPSRPVMPVEPEPDKNTQFNFNTQVLGGPTYYFDPPSTTGYTYEVLSGPQVTQLLLPVGGDGRYRVELWDGSQWVDVGVDVQAGGLFDLRAYRPGGVDRFRVLGIETGEGESQNFVTGMRFAGTGDLVMRQTALPAVPEPGTWGLLAGGLGALVWRRRSRRQVAAEAG